LSFAKTLHTFFITESYRTFKDARMNINNDAVQHGSRKPYLSLFEQGFR
jgi:hypothetical protein